MQIFLDKPDLKIIENQTQRALRNFHAHSVILDVLCKDIDGNLFNIEVQKDDKKRSHRKSDEYQKRVRFHLANMDTTFAEKGGSYHQLPELYAVFLSQLDPFEEHCTTYHIRRSLAETNTTVYNGIHEIYINTAIDDGSDIAELMQYFENSNGLNPKFKKLCKRVQHFKESAEGVNIMSSVFEEYAEERAQERIKEYAAEHNRITAARLLKEGATVEFVAKIIPSLSIDEIKQLQQEPVQV